MDERPDQFEGFAYLYDNDPEMPGTFAPILTGNKANPANFIVHFTLSIKEPKSQERGQASRSFTPEFSSHKRQWCRVSGQMSY